MLDRVTFLLNGDLSPVFGGDGVAVETTAETGQAAPAAIPQEAESPGFFGQWGFIGIWVAVIAVFYFLTVRPQRKRAKETQEMQSNLKVGDNVVTSNGMFGRIAEVATDRFVVEFGDNKSIFIPVRKSDVHVVPDAKKEDKK